MSVRVWKAILRASDASNGVSPTGACFRAMVALLLYLDVGGGSAIPSARLRLL